MTAEGGNPAQGFEALMAALFPVNGAAGVPETALAPENTLTSETPLAGDASTTSEQPDAATGTGASSTDASTATPDNAAASELAAAIAAGSPAPTADAAHTEPAAGGDGVRTPPAWGRDKTAGTPAAPAFAHAAPQAGLADRFAAPADAPPPVVEETAPGSTATPNAVATDTHGSTPEPGRRADPPAWGLAKPEAGPAAPALANANAKARLTETETPPAADAATAPDAPDAPRPTPPSPPATPPSSPTVIAHRPEPPPAPGRTGKSERGRNAEPAEPAGGASPPTGAAKAASAKSPTAPAVDDVERPAPDAKQGSEAAGQDTVEPSVPGETRAATGSGGPSAIVTHAVRGAPETVASLAAHIVKKLEGKATRFDIELDPAGLGKVDVRLEIGAHGRLTAAMTCDNPQAAQDLRARATELQRALEQAGFDLSGGLSFDVAGDRGQGGGRAQHEQAGGDRGFRSQAFQAALDTAGDAADSALGTALNIRRGWAAGLDLRI